MQLPDHVLQVYCVNVPNLVRGYKNIGSFVIFITTKCAQLSITLETVSATKIPKAVTRSTILTVANGIYW